MRYYLPVKVYDERDCVQKHAAEITALGKRALIVTGRNSAQKNGSLDDVTAALKQENVDYLLFSEVEENPSTETVFAAKERFSSEAIELVIGVGGGSALDAAKAIALVLKHPEADLAYLYDKEKDPSALPLVCVPTTCGTGSEVTGVSVLTRNDKKTKISMVHKVFPDLALVDGKYLRSASRNLIVNTSVDALSHLYESVLNAKVDEYVKMSATAGLKCWAKIKDILLGKREAKEEDFALLMRSSVFAGMSIAQSGTSLPHALSYVITYDLGIPHGQAVGFFLPAFLEEAPAGERDVLLQLSGFSDMKDANTFFDSVLNDLQIPEAELRRTFEAVVNNKAKMDSASYAVTEETLHRIVFG